MERANGRTVATMQVVPCQSPERERAGKVAGGLLLRGGGD